MSFDWTDPSDPRENVEKSRQRRAVDRERARLTARRRGHLRLAAAGLVVVVVIIAVATSGGGSGDTAGARTAGKVTSVTPPQMSAQVLRQAIAGRSGTVSVAVYDLDTKREWTLNPNVREQTASIVKADILETLLYRNQRQGNPVDDAESPTAENMIEESDNDSASDLYDQIDNGSGMKAFNQRAGLTRTTPGAPEYWGETLTTPTDQIRLLKQLTPSGRLLNQAAKAYQLGLMEHVESGENWGVTGGVPANDGVTVALKNGWTPLTSGTDWEVNSIGWVQGAGHNYLIAVMTAHDPSQQYGITTITKLAAAVYDHLGPAAGSGTRTIAQGVPAEE